MKKAMVVMMAGMMMAALTGCGGGGGSSAGNTNSVGSTGSGIVVDKSASFIPHPGAPATTFCSYSATSSRLPKPVFTTATTATVIYNTPTAINPPVLVDQYTGKTSPATAALQNLRITSATMPNGGFLGLSYGASATVPNGITTSVYLSNADVPQTGVQIFAEHYQVPSGGGVASLNPALNFARTGTQLTLTSGGNTSGGNIMGSNPTTGAPVVIGASTTNGTTIDMSGSVDITQPVYAIVRVCDLTTSVCEIGSTLLDMR
jgi:hypothetical protein